jgi:hypothetical protein
LPRCTDTPNATLSHSIHSRVSHSTRARARLHDPYHNPERESVHGPVSVVGFRLGGLVVMDEVMFNSAYRASLLCNFGRLVSLPGF